jgi:hypothetical protein
MVSGEQRGEEERIGWTARRSNTPNATLATMLLRSVRDMRKSALSNLRTIGSDMHGRKLREYRERQQDLPIRMKEYS